MVAFGSRYVVVAPAHASLNRQIVRRGQNLARPRFRKSRVGPFHTPFGAQRMKRRSISALNLFAITVWAIPAFAAGGRQVDVSERIKGSQRVVVAKTAKITPEWRTNEHGDKLI